MCDIEAQTADLVFAGQTVEHLWGDELCGFLLKAARIAKPGARFIIDSPNERITEPTRWNHPEHTIELRADEMQHLLELCDFEVTRKVGH